MIIISLLAMAALISSTKASPMSYNTYRRREIPMDERPELVLFYDQRNLEVSKDLICVCLLLKIALRKSIYGNLFTIEGFHAITR